MRQHIVVKLLFWGLLVLGFNSAKAQERIVGDIIVMLKHGNTIETALKSTQNHFPDAPITLGERVAPTLNIWLIKTDATWEYQVLDYLRGLPEVQVAQFNRIAEERNTPNDTLYPQQWNFENTGQGSGIPGADIKASQAWDITTGGFTVAGDAIVVAMVDKGFELLHDDLTFWQNTNEIDGDSIDNDGNGYIDDVKGWNVVLLADSIPVNSHGTMCAGLVGAKSNNTFGTAGINWGLPMLPVVCTQYNESQVVAAYAYILELRRLYNQSNGAKGAFVVATNSSFGIDYGKASDYPIWCAMYDSLGKQGILSTAATANLNVNVESGGDIPSTCISDFLVMVTNTTRTDFKYPSAGYGNASIDLGAPGTGIWSTNSGNGHSASTGTSFASPQVAGAVALLYSAADSVFMDATRQYPDIMAREVKRIILQSVDIIPDLASTTVSGGRLNLYKALERFQNEFCGRCFAINSVVQQVSCFGDSSGSITLSIDSGTTPYTFAWSNGDTTAFIQNLPIGNYEVVVTDATGSMRHAYYTISQPAALQVGYIVQRSKGTDGSIKVLTLGGSPPFQYVWQNNITTTDSAGHLAPGNYGITVSDQNGCYNTDTVTVYRDSSVNTEFDVNAINRIALFPNPTNGLLHYEFETSAQGILAFTITDLLGSVVTAQSQTVHSNMVSGNISLEALVPGIYLLKVTINGIEGRVYKVFKQ
ncbi:hypothetical protein BH09BAC1_BH09BAC1_06220 [soil metagenome]